MYGPQILTLCRPIIQSKLRRLDRTFSTQETLYLYPSDSMQISVTLSISGNNIINGSFPGACCVCDSNNNNGNGNVWRIFSFVFAPQGGWLCRMDNSWQRRLYTKNGLLPTFSPPEILSVPPHLPFSLLNLTLI